MKKIKFKKNYFLFTSIILVSFVSVFSFNNLFYLNKTNSTKNVYNSYSWNVKDTSINEKNSATIITDPNGNDHLYTCGTNNYGQLGIGSLTNATEPTEIHYYDNGTVNNTEDDLTSLPEGWTIDRVEVGTYFMYALATDSDGIQHLYSWGCNASGELAQGEESLSTVLTPHEVIYPSGYDPLTWKIKDISLSTIPIYDYEYALVLFENDMGEDHLYSVGSNSNGKLGIGSFSITSISTFRQIDYPPLWDFGHFQITNVEAFSRSSYISVIDSSNNNSYFYAWGSGSEYSLGNNSDNTEVSPTLITPPGVSTTQWTVEQIAPSSSSCDVLVEYNGEQHVYGWGNYDKGIVPGYDTIVYTPQEIIYGLDSTGNPIYDFPSDWEINQIASTDSSFAAVVTDNNNKERIFTSGLSANGQLGTNSSLPSINLEEITYNDGLSNYSNYHLYDGYNSYLLSANDSKGNQQFFGWGSDSNNFLGIVDNNSLEHYYTVPTLSYSNWTLSNLNYFYDENSILNYSFISSSYKTIEKITLENRSDSEMIFESIPIWNGSTNAYEGTFDNLTSLENGDYNFSLTINYVNLYNQNLSFEFSNNINIVVDNGEIIIPSNPESSNTTILIILIVIIIIILLLIISSLFVINSNRKKRRKIQNAINEELDDE